MANLKDNKNSTSPFKKGLQNFFGSIADSYYKEGKKDLTSDRTTHNEKTVLLDMLKSLFGSVEKVDNTLKDTVEKTFFSKASIPVKAFARLRVEDFFYATVINNLLLNVQNRSNMEKYGYTEHIVRKIEETWRDLINKAMLIIRKQIKAEIVESLISKSEYYSFSSGVSEESPNLKMLVKDFEERILLKECLEFLEDKRREFLDKNPINVKRG